MVKTFSDMILADNVDEISVSTAQMSEYLILLHCEAGTLQLTLNDTQYMVRPGNILVCMPQSLIGHYMRTPDFRGRVLAVGRHFFDNILSDCFEVEPNWWQKAAYVRENPVWTITDYQARLIQAYYQLIIVYAEDQQTPYRQRIIRAMAQAAAFEILGCLDNVIDHQVPATSTIEMANSPKGRLLHQFMLLLNEQGNTQREVQYYAGRMLITPKYLSTICKEITGRTASDWINQVMAGHVRHLLTQTDLSIKEIAYRMEFPDVSFFCKYVRKHLGQSPSAVRRDSRR